MASYLPICKKQGNDTPPPALCLIKGFQFFVKTYCMPFTCTSYAVRMCFTNCTHVHFTPFTGILYVIRHMSSVRCTLHVLWGMSYVVHRESYIVCHTSYTYVVYHTLYIILLTSYGIRCTSYTVLWYTICTYAVSHTFYMWQFSERK